MSKIFKHFIAAATSEKHSRLTHCL